MDAFVVRYTTVPAVVSITVIASVLDPVLPLK